MKRLTQTLIIAALSGAIVAGCVKVKTGQTSEEVLESNKVRARQVRIQWAEQIRDASPKETAQLVKTHIDSVSAWYIRYGYKVADEWHKGNQAKGEAIDGAEMRKNVDAWIAVQKPILNAYEDNLEFGISKIKQSGEFSPETMELFDRFAEQFYTNRSTVFYPHENVEFYESALIEIQRVTESLSRQLEQELKKY